MIEKGYIDVRWRRGGQRLSAISVEDAKHRFFWVIGIQALNESAPVGKDRTLVDRALIGDFSGTDRWCVLDKNRAHHAS